MAKTIQTPILSVYDQTGTKVPVPAIIGEVPQIQIGTVESLPAGVDPVVTVTGDKKSPELNFGLPKASEIVFDDEASTIDTKMRIKLSSADEVLIPEVLPSTGSSTEDTMSQKAITGALFGKVGKDEACNALYGHVIGRPVSISDSAEFEHEIKCHVAGNEFDVSKVTPSGANMYVQDGSIFAKSNTGGGTNENLSVIAPRLIPGKSYVISRSGTAHLARNYVYLIGSKRVWKYNESIVIETADLTAPLGFYGNDDFVELGKIQIEEGTVATTPVKPFINDLSSVVVSQFGANMFDPSTLQPGSSAVISDNGVEFIPDTTPHRNVYFKCNVPPYTKFRIYGADVKKPTNGLRIGVQYKTSPKYVASYYSGMEIDTKEGIEAFSFYCMSADSVPAKVVNLQFKVGEEGVYQPYKEKVDFRPDADGNVSGMRSYFPDTMVFTDTPDAYLSCSYNRDINKAFAALEAKIASAIASIQNNAQPQLQSQGEMQAESDSQQ